MPFNAVMIIPTGLGCAIGGHAGDATPAAKLLASVCDKLILHPNVVNASDINEMPANSLYVEGSILDRFLEGVIKLREPRRVNHVLVVVNDLDPVIVNGVAAARHTIGMNAELVKLDAPLELVAGFNDDGSAGGQTSGVGELLRQVGRLRYDALAIVTPIKVLPEVELDYFRHGGVNPWGGIEAKVSRMVARVIQKPVAHAPFIPDTDPISRFNEVVNGRMGAAMVSSAYLFCLMKGLHRAPRPSATGLGVDEVDVLVSPNGCWGRPHEACVAHGIPIIMVEDNRCSVFTRPLGRTIYAANYLEAAGILASMRANVLLWSVLAKPRLMRSNHGEAPSRQEDRTPKAPNRPQEKGEEEGQAQEADARLTV